MSLPPQFLDELRNRISIVSVIGRKVTWDKAKTQTGRGDYWAPCPFHNEKTPSFHCTESTGRYYCFGCHAKGDAITFVMETENRPFMEAVEILAQEAGMQLPERDPKAKEKADQYAVMFEIMEQAVQFFRMQLKTQAARPARDYLLHRQLDEAAQGRHDLGFAPNARDALLQHFSEKGISLEQLVELGLVGVPDDGRAPYDRFRDRIMFPIRDGRGRAIGFGGRAMNEERGPKYYNSTQTPVFDKGRNLYNIQHARAALAKGAPLIVAEGYMDVIALREAGFEGAVAPLGTAVTENQLELLWRLSPEPVIALDGDSAGLRAAYRVIDLAMPHLGAGRALRFALMPQGADPDDVIRENGAEAFQAILDNTLSMLDLLWRRETEGRQFDSPERRAALHRSMVTAIEKIPDIDLKRYYVQEIKDREWNLHMQARKAGRKEAVSTAQSAKAQTQNSGLSVMQAEQTQQLQEQVLVTTLLCVPQLRTRYSGMLEMLELKNKRMRALLDFILEADDKITAEALQQDLKAQKGSAILDHLFDNPHIRLCVAVREPQNEERAQAALEEVILQIGSHHGLEREFIEAMRDLNDPDLSEAEQEAILWRLGQAALDKERKWRGPEVDQTEYLVAPSGVRVNRSDVQVLREVLQQFHKEKGLESDDS